MRVHHLLRGGRGQPNIRRGRLPDQGGAAPNRRRGHPHPEARVRVGQPEAGPALPAEPQDAGADREGDAGRPVLPRGGEPEEPVQEVHGHGGGAAGAQQGQEGRLRGELRQRPGRPEPAHAVRRRGGQTEALQPAHPGGVPEALAGRPPHHGAPLHAPHLPVLHRPHRPHGLRRRHRRRRGGTERGVGREDGARAGEDAGGAAPVQVKTRTFYPGLSQLLALKISILPREHEGNTASVRSCCLRLVPQHSQFKYIWREIQ